MCLKNSIAVTKPSPARNMFIWSSRLYLLLQRVWATGYYADEILANVNPWRLYGLKMIKMTFWFGQIAFAQTWSSYTFESQHKSIRTGNRLPLFGRCRARPFIVTPSLMLEPLKRWIQFKYTRLSQHKEKGRRIWLPEKFHLSRSYGWNVLYNAYPPPNCCESCESLPSKWSDRSLDECTFILFFIHFHGGLGFRFHFTRNEMLWNSKKSSN